jgi:hypothetical protein
MARKVGFVDPRVFSWKVINIGNEQIRNLVGNINFYSVTYRLWKLRGLEDTCEDYGHTAVYDEKIPQSPFKFELDNGHLFNKNKPERICGNTALMISQTRLKKYFRVSGTFKQHFGAFQDCKNVRQDNKPDQNSSNCCR